MTNAAHCLIWGAGVTTQLTVIGAVKLVGTVAAIYEAVALPGGQDSGSRGKEGHDELHNRDR